jgi:hypothetical protein
LSRFADMCLAIGRGRALRRLVAYPERRSAGRATSGRLLQETRWPIRAPSAVPSPVPISAVCGSERTKRTIGPMTSPKDAIKSTLLASRSSRVLIHGPESVDRLTRVRGAAPYRRNPDGLVFHMAVIPPAARSGSGRRRGPRLRPDGPTRRAQCVDAGRRRLYRWSWCLHRRWKTSIYSIKSFFDTTI